MLFKVVLVLGTASAAMAQSGGSFTVTQSVVASGGGRSTGASYTSTGTVGQAAAGTSSTGGTYTLSSGFWNPSLAPTAAHVAIAGRVLTADGSGVRNAVVRVTDQNGHSFSVTSNAFGFYRLDSVEVGQAYMLSVESRRFRFTPRTFMLTDELLDADMIAEP